jgi:4-diphosphocytidyl-2-C-methyl-D-erythritol kinase
MSSWPKKANPRWPNGPMHTEGFAPAKINLTLHVTGQRPDGYHLLDSLVVFADVGDRVSAVADAGLGLTVTGPQAAQVPAGNDNLVLRAARLFGAGPGAQLTLEKHLPVASGIGGGSADAAAALRVLARLWHLPLPAADNVLRLGADVPVCLESRARRMSGVGECLAPVPRLPAAWLVLVNPGVAVATPAVFAALEQRENPAMPAEMPPFPDATALAAFLRAMRNDLEAPAIRVAPVIATVLAALARLPACRVARMSGSGATCFGLFAQRHEADAAATRLRATHPDWWVVAAPILRAGIS